jgi:hypothetical protein
VWPIPQNEIDTDLNLKQHKEWGGEWFYNTIRLISFLISHFNKRYQILEGGTKTRYPSFLGFQVQKSHLY